MNEENTSGSAVAVKVDRVFDSCSDKDCITNLQVMLEGGELPEQYTSVKTRCCSIDNVCMSVEPIPFNRGYYSVDVTYTFGIELLAYDRSCDAQTPIRGTASASKSVILYGSESSTKTFFSNGARIGDTNNCCEVVNLPTASCQCVDPIALETRIAMAPPLPPMPGMQPPQPGVPLPPRRCVLLTLGVFSVIELSRPVTMMVSALPYSVPTKTCTAEGTDSPCEIFSKLSFPTDEFLPQMPNAGDAGTGCTPQRTRYDGFDGRQQMPGAAQSDVHI